MWRRVGIVLLVIALGLAAWRYFSPIPAAMATPALPASEVVAGTPPTLPWPAKGSAAVGVSKLGAIANSGNEQAAPAASVTKVMTALLILEDKPLKLNETGPNITIMDVDVQGYKSDLAQNQSVIEVRAGEQLSELQALQALLIPSANNLAETLARWDAGSMDAFVAKMNARAAKLRLSHTKFADASGASDQSVSTPSDLMALGIAAMNNDVFAKIVSTGQVELPVVGTVYNVDSALGQSGIIGIKTGSGLNLGANFLFAASVAVDGFQKIIYGCVMGQPTLDRAFSAAKALIASVQSALHVRRVLAKNQAVATYVTAWGAQSDLVASDNVDLAEWPGMVLSQRLAARAIVVDQPLPAATTEGTLKILLGDYNVDVTLVTSDAMYPPGRLWRLTRIRF